MAYIHPMTTTQTPKTIASLTAAINAINERILAARKSDDTNSVTQLKAERDNLKAQVRSLRTRNAPTRTLINGRFAG